MIGIGVGGGEVLWRTSACQNGDVRRPAAREKRRRRGLENGAHDLKEATKYAKGEEERARGKGILLSVVLICPINYSMSQLIIGSLTPSRRAGYGF